MAMRSSSASQNKQRVMEGPLSKWTNVVHGWQYRWFVLDQASGLLSYYTSKEKMKRGSRRATIQLKGAIIGIDDEDDCTFTIRDQTRIFHFQAQDSQEREKWVQALEACIRKLVRPPVQWVHVVQHCDGRECWTHYRGREMMELPLPSASKKVSLEQRLGEADGYYRLLRGQVQTLSQSLNQTEEAKQLLVTAKTMLEALQQTIDLLKDTQLSESDLSPSASVEATPPPHGPWEANRDLATEGGTLGEVAEVGVEETEEEGEGEGEKIAEEEVEERGGEGENEEKQKAETATADSESESDASSDEFYDADEELEEPPLSPMAAVAISVQPADSEADPSDVEEDQELHEDDDASSGVAQNRSIIMHMLSQARVGMDLTRITLPTFILEKRSLLEMYAEFFAHPDLFASIPDNSDPRERIIAIARYYCSAFHAARKGAIAKKPYNPILGETFRCYWDLPDGRRKPPDEESKSLLQSGPVPYASYSSVAFVAEQVSHHPPVSGFYAECLPKRMYVNGSIYTKSKFLGLSLGVHNIGSVRLYLVDYGEEYKVNLPNAYARSILTVPWLELGGKCHIECVQNGYSADVEFHCKPFYGGRKHRITCNVNHTSERKPIMKVEGEWNGVMYIKHPNGEQEVFVDTINTPTVKKKLQKLSAQDPGESRRRWQHVTEALFKKDIEEATDAKHALEEKQRADAKWRQENGVEWKQQLFHLEGDTWVYNTPLSSRTTRTSERHS